jgi:hypothetical protein
MQLDMGACTKHWQERAMAERICAVDGKKKNIEGGKICEKGHFICRDHVYSGVIIIDERKCCPIDKTPLR